MTGNQALPAQAGLLAPQAATAHPHDAAGHHAIGRRPADLPLAAVQKKTARYARCCSAEPRQRCWLWPHRPWPAPPVVVTRPAPCLSPRSWVAGMSSPAFAARRMETSGTGLIAGPTRLPSNRSRSYGLCRGPVAPRAGALTGRALGVSLGGPAGGRTRDLDGPRRGRRRAGIRVGGS